MVGESRYGLRALLLICCFLTACGRPADREAVDSDVMICPIPEDAMVVDFPSGEAGATAIETSAGDIETFNPLISESLATSLIMGRVLEGLTTIDSRTGQVVPELAKSWEVSEDNLQYTFYLRKGICWSDGHPFTADDVIFTWATFFAKETDPDTGEVKTTDEGRPVYRYKSRSTFSKLINGVEPKVEKLDDYTVRFTTPEIYAPFLLFGGGTKLLPKHKLESAFEDGTLLDQWNLETGINNPRSIVGLGPFAIESYRPGERLVLKRNPNYWKVNTDGERLPYIERIIIKFVADGGSSSVAFAQGRTDFESLSPDDAAWIQKKAEEKDFTIVDLGPSSGINFIWFNLNDGLKENGEPYIPKHKSEWFGNREFRQAVSYAINREGIVQGVFFGRAEALNGYVSPKRKFWKNDDLRIYDYNPERSKELLVSNGFQYDANGQLFDREGNRVQFELITNSGNELRAEIATVFKENMADIGIAVELKFLDFNTVIIRTSDSFDYEACMLGLGGGADDPFASKDILMSGGRLHFWNPSQESPATEWEAEIDRLMIEVGRNLEPAVRQKYFYRVQEILAEEQPMIMLVTSKAYVGYQNRWQNVEPTPIGGVLWNLESLWARPQP